MILVTKFGGTSIGSPERLIKCTNLLKPLILNSRLIVTVSALSSTLKINGTTSLLLEASTHILIPSSQHYIHIINNIHSFHAQVAKDCIKNQAILSQLLSDIQLLIDRLHSFMAAAEIIDELSPRSKDVIVSMGEALSAKIMAAVLTDNGFNALFVDLSKLVTDKSITIVDQKFFDYLVTRLEQVLVDIGFHEDQSLVPVFTGFFGPVPGSLLDSIGRGYTDLIGALLSVASKASEFQVYKEVDGIFTADPRKVADAKLISDISPEEAAEVFYINLVDLLWL